MKTVLELLDSAPAEQVTRMRIAFKAVADGQWADAAWTLRNAARESGGQFAADCDELAFYCDRQGK